MKKYKHLTLLSSIIFLLMLNITSIKGQGSCNTAYNLSIVPNFDTTYTVNDSVLWLQFQPIEDRIEIEVNSSNSNVTSIELFSGSCNSLNSISLVNDTIIGNDTLIINNNYFLKITLSSVVSTNISVQGICLTCFPNAVLNVYPNPVCIGDIVTFDIYGSTICNGQFTMWDWGGFQGTLISSNPEIFIANNSGIFTVTFYVVHDEVMLNGSIEIVKDDSASVVLEVLDSLPRFEYPDKICLGDPANFIDKSICPVPTAWNWDFGDGANSNIQNPSHMYTQAGTYTVSLQTIPAGYTKTETIEVVEPIKPIIVGYKNNCDSLVDYTIQNLDPDYTYTWSTEIVNVNANGTVANTITGPFIINNTASTVTANTATIDWDNPASSFPSLPSYVKVIVEAHMNNSNCSATTTYKIYQCCENEDYELIHDTVYYTDVSFNNRNLMINGLVVFEDNVTFNNTFVNMGPMAKILIKGNKKLESIKSTFASRICHYMSDGIYNETKDNTIVFRDESKLYDAINGIKVQKGATIRVDNSDFINNLTAIQLLNCKSQVYPMPPPPFTAADVSITDNNFTASSTSSLFHPYPGHQPLTGIKISNMENIQIGDNTLGGNTFSMLRNGITIFNSKVEIYNNTFQDIENQMAPTANEEAAISINAYGLGDVNNIGNITIGASGLQHNQFINCYHSVFSNNSKLIVDNNIFNYGHQSINVFNYKNGTAITNSRFKDVYFGIKVNNLLGVVRQLIIKDNYFEGQNDNSNTETCREAINVINCNSQINSSIKTQISNNTIRFKGHKNYLTSGIRVQNCDGIMVNSNFINRMTTLSNVNTDWNETIGVRVATSQGAQITDNYIMGFGQSIKTYGNLTATQFSCNELLIYKYGFSWGLYTTLSNQGIPPGGNILQGVNTHNRWASHATITGNQKLQDPTPNILNTAPVNWYHFSNMGSQYIPNAVYDNIPSLKIQPIVNDNAVHQCGGGSGGGGTGGTGNSTGGGSSTNSSSPVLGLLDSIEDPEMRDFLFEDILNGEQYIDLQNEYRAYDADFLYKMLADDTTMMWLGGTKDIDYRQFFDSISQSNLGEFAEVYQLIENGDYAQATTLNTSIVPEQNIFVNLKTVMSIYLSTWCMEQYDLSNTQYTTLYQIANQTPYEGGDAVYTARIMIGYEPDEHGVAYRMHKRDKVDEKEELVLYPNPASNEVTIEFTNDAFENVDALLQVYSITGKLIYQTRFNTNNSFKVLSVDMLKNGVYLYHISLSNGIDKTGKLVILKQ